MGGARRRWAPPGATAFLENARPEPAQRMKSPVRQTASPSRLQPARPGWRRLRWNSNRHSLNYERSSALWRQADWLLLLHSHEGSSCAAKGKVQVDGQAKLLPAPQLLPESLGLGTPKWVG